MVIFQINFNDNAQENGGLPLSLLGPTWAVPETDCPRDLLLNVPMIGVHWFPSDDQLVVPVTADPGLARMQSVDWSLPAEVASMVSQR